MKVVNSLQLIEQLQLYDKTKQDFIYFRLWPKQKEFLELIHTKSKVIILKKRQTGISTLTGADSLIQCISKTNFTVLVLSITADDAQEYLQRIRDMYNSAPQWLKDINPCTKGLDAGDEMWFTSGSRIISLSARSGRSRTADRVIIDEAAFITRKKSNIELDEVLKAIEAVIEKAAGQLILISTANGPNKFKAMFVAAWNKVTNFIPFFFSCWDDPTFTPEARQKVVEDYGVDHANQEHPRNWEEAFLSSGRIRFDKETLEYYTQNRIIKPALIGDITSLGVEKNDQGNIKFFQKKKKHGQYVIFADVAEGLEVDGVPKGDRSIAKVFDLETQEQVAEWSGWIEFASFGTILYHMGVHWNNAYIAPEANNHGHASIVQLKNVHEYPPELIFESNYVREKADDAFKHPERRFGWVTSSTTKKLIIDNLAERLLKHTVPYLCCEDLEELYSYIVDKKGATNAEAGTFDDRVMCLAIAYYLLQFYELKFLDEWEKCANCDNCSEGRCDLTQRQVDPDDKCVLYEEIYFELPEKELDSFTKGI